MSKKEYLRKPDATSVRIDRAARRESSAPWSLEPTKKLAVGLKFRSTGCTGAPAVQPLALGQRLQNHAIPAGPELPAKLSRYNR